MTYAIMNIISLNPENADDFPDAVPTGEAPVRIGDRFEDCELWRDGLRVLTLLEEAQSALSWQDWAVIRMAQRLAALRPVPPEEQDDPALCSAFERLIADGLSPDIEDALQALVTLGAISQEKAQELMGGTHDGEST